MKLALGASLSLLLAGCGGQVNGVPGGPVEPNPGSTVAFTPSSVTATRVPAQCGAGPTPYQSSDTFSLDIVGAKSDAGTSTAIFIDVPGQATVNQPISLQVQAYSAPAQYSPASQYASSSIVNGSTVSLDLQWSATAGDIDPKPMAFVTLTVVAFPTTDGEPLRIRVQVGFTDGKTLDAAYSGNVQSILGGCPMG